jgi:hypothetical protein
MAEPIVCPLWNSEDDRFCRRRYHAWDRPCALCGRKVVVSDAVKRCIESGSGTVVVCDQCALARFAEVEGLHGPEPDGAKAAEMCPACAALKEQEEAAA